MIWYCEFTALEDISKTYKDRSRTDVGIYINSCLIGFFLAPKSLHFSQVFHSLFSWRRRKLKDGRLIKDSNVVIAPAAIKERIPLGYQDSNRIGLLPWAEQF